MANSFDDLKKLLEQNQSSSYPITNTANTSSDKNTTSSSSGSSKSTTSGSGSGKKDSWDELKVLLERNQSSSYPITNITMTLDDVDNWYNSVNSISQKANSYLTSGGYKTPDTSLIEELNSYRMRAYDVEKYLQDHKNELESYEDALINHYAVVDYLNQVLEGLEESNQFFSNFSDETDYSQWEKYGNLSEKEQMEAVQSLHNAMRSDSIQGNTDRTESLQQEMDWLRNKGGEGAQALFRQLDYEDNEKRIAEIDQKIKELSNTRYSNRFGIAGRGLMDSGVKENQDITKEIEALKAEQEALKAANTRYKRQQKTLDENYNLTLKSDFDEVSSQRDFDNPTMEELREYDSIAANEANAVSEALNNFGSYDKDGNLRDFHGNIVTTTEAPEIKDKLGVYLAASDADIAEAYNRLSATNGNTTDTWATLIQQGDANGWKQLDETEIGIYYYLLNEVGQESAYKFLDDMTTELTRRETEKRTEAVYDAEGLEKLAYNIASIPQNVFGGAIAFLDDAVHTLKGEDINPYSRLHAAQNMAQATRQATAEDFDAATNSKKVLGMTLGEAYQAVMSGADSMFGALTLGAAGYGVFMGMGAASTEAKDLYERGASQGQIVFGSLLAGAAEGFFEKFSIDKLLKMGGSKTVLQLVKNFLVQGGIEASEEMATEVANTITNAIVMGSQSDWEAAIQRHLDDGKAPNEAQALALMDVGMNVWKAGLGGFIAGSGMGTTGSIGSYAGYQSEMKQSGKDIMEAGGYENLKALAMEVANEGKASTAEGRLGNFIEKTDAKVQGVTETAATKHQQNSAARSVGKLADRVDTVRHQQNTEEIQASLESKGMSTRQAKQAAKVLSEAVDTRNFSSADIKALMRNQEVVETLEEVIKNPASSVNKRNLKHTLAKLGVDVTGMATAGASAVTSAETSERSTFVENPSERILEASTDGKTIISESGEAVQIKEISSIKNGEMVLRLEDGRTINAKEVEYASVDEALVYESVLRLGTNAAAANSILKTWNPESGVSAEVFVRGVEEAYRYGQYNIPVQEMLEKGSFASELTEEQRATVYKLGQIFTGKSVAKQQAVATTAKKATTGKSTAVGKVHFEGDTSGLTDRQTASLSAMETVAEALGVQIYVFESEVGADGKRVGSNGWYDTKDGSIHIDLYAGANGQGTMLFTLAHELTHFIKQWSPAKFKVLANFLMKEYGKQGVSVDALVQAQIRKAANNGRTIDYDTAYEEVIADSMETMLADGRVVEKLAKLKQQDRTLWQKIKEFISELAAKIRKVYAGLQADSVEGRYVAEMKDAIEQLQKMFTEAVAEASENYQFTIGSRNMNDFSAAQNTDGETLFQYRAMEADEATYRHMLKTWGKMSDKQITNLFTTIDKAMDIIKDNLEALDYAWETDINDRAFSPVKPNSDSLYQVSLDFSTLCRKRILQQTVQAHLQEALNKPLSREEGIAIRDALIEIQKEGRQIEVACALCYVESARMKSPQQIKRFMDNREKVLKEFFASKSGGDMKAKVKQAEADARERLGVGDKPLKQLPGKVASEIRAAKKAAKAAYVPTAAEQKAIDIANGMTVSDFTSPEGLENLAKNHRDLFDAYTSYIRNATKSKGIENDTWWRAGDSQQIGDVLIAKMNNENGLRSQSWSDFQVIHILDYIAATIELATRNTKEQAYSKVPDYVELMGKTGVMINMSLIPTAVFDGSLQYDSVEGMDYNRSLELRDKYPATAGTICIGIDNKQIQMLLADSTIDYVIPYHRSGMAAHIRKSMHIPTWSEYQDYQSESKLNRAEAERRASQYGVKLLAESDPMYQKHTAFSEWFDITEVRKIAERENANPTDKAKQERYGIMYGGYMAMQNAGNNYLKLCAERGLAPKFSHAKADFTGEENYWKLLIDRKMVNNATGEIIEQQNIKPIFEESEVLRILNEELDRYPKVKADQEYAIRRVTEKYLSGELKGGMSAEAVAEVMKKPVDNVAKTNVFASSEHNASLTDADLNDYMRTGLTLHTRHKKENMLKAGKKPILTSSLEYDMFISDVISGKAGGEVRAFARVGLRLANAIKDVRSSLDLTGNYLEANADGLREAYKRHSTPKEQGDIPLTAEDFKRIPEYMDGFDGVLSVDTYKNRTEIHLYKRSDDGYIHILTVASKERESLQVTKLIGVSAEKFEAKYAKKIERNTGSPRGQTEKSEASNPSTKARHTAGVLSDTRVSQPGDDVKRSDRDYSRAVKRDDMAAAARMVDEAANAALSESQARVNGKLVHLFHGSESFGFTEFDPSRSVENTLFFSDNIKVSAEYNNGKAVPQRIGKPFVAQKSYNAKDLNELADRYRGYKGIQIKELTVDAKAGDRAVHLVTHTGIDRYYSAAEFHKTVWDIDKAYERGSGIYEAVLDMKRPLIVDAKYNNWDAIPFEGRVRNTRQIARSARLRGYDGVIFKNLHDVAGTNEVNPAYFSTVYAVFKPNQVFSADPVTYDNNGDVIPLSERFNPENNDIRYSDRDYVTYDRTAILKESKVDEYLEDYAAKSSPKYAQAHIAYMSPSDFLKLTTDGIVERYHIAEQTGELDEARLSGSRPGIYLRIDHETGEVIGHEGRHRMSAMSRAGIERVPVLLVDTSNKMTKTDMESIILSGQFDGTQTAVVLDAIPLNYQNRSRVIENFATMSSTQRIRERYGWGKTLKFQDRETDSVSNRSLLANALESAVQNDIERTRLEEYRGKVDMLNAEEQKLTELRAEIKELSFAKGPKDTAKIRSLQFEARQTANRINTIDKQLLTLEAAKPLQNVLQREKRMAYKRAERKGKEALEAYRERALEKQREIINRYQESRAKGVESRHKTAMRHKIQNVVNELNNLLLHGNKDRHVPIQLQRAVAEALDAINMDTVTAEERIAKLEQDLMKAKTPEKIQEISRKIDHIRDMGDKMSNRLKALKEAYDEFLNSDDPLIANSHDEALSAHIQTLITKVGDTPLRNMTLEQLEDVYDVYKIVLTTVRNANKAFKTAKYESIADLGNRTIEEVEKVGGKHERRIAALDGIKKFGWNNLKPVYAFEQIGSDTLSMLFENVRAGEDTWAVDITEAKAFSDSMQKKYGYKKWNFDKEYHFKSSAGVDFSLTIDEIMALYAYSKRKQADDHLEKGGFVFDSNVEVTEKKNGIPVKYKVNTATAHNLSKEILAEITGVLTDNQKAFADEMQNYLSTTMGEKGNEVSLEMYGIKLFKEQFYFPLKSAKQFLFEQNETAGEVRVKNSGFTKEVKAHANNPIILTGFMDAWANHVNDMSMYHAFVLPLEDFNRVFNYKTPRAGTQNQNSVKEFIQNAYGPQAVNYVSQLLKDLNGGARSDPRESTGKALVGSFKKAAVFASASVVIQQPSAVARALALVNPKYFDFNPKLIQHKKLWEEVKKYAPVAIIKEMGHFDTDMGMSTVDYIIGDKTLMDRADDVLSWAPAMADELTWCHIWTAVKRETLAKNRGMNIKSDEFLQKVGKRFTEVIVKTQVYDSVLSRSANMRSKSVYMNMLTSFMAEPTTSINMLQDALIKGKRGNKKASAKTIGAVYASVLLNAALVSFVYASRDDDEDETWWEKYTSSLAVEMVDGILPFGYLPIVKDVWSLLQGYDVERADMSLISTASEALTNMVKAMAVDKSDMDDEELAEHRQQVSESVWGLVDAVASIAGIPLKNIRRDAMAVVNLSKIKNAGLKNNATSMWNEVVESLKNTIPVWGWLPDEKKGDKLYDAIVSGDAAYLERVEGLYDDEAAVESARIKALRENDPRILAAAQAEFNNNPGERVRLAREIIAEGNFVQDDVVRAINAEVTKLEIAARGYVESEKSSPKFYTVENYYDAIMMSDTTTADEAKEYFISGRLSLGDSEEDAQSSFESSFTSTVKGEYLEGNIGQDTVMDLLTTYGGDSEGDAETHLKKWDFETTYGYSWDMRDNAYRLGDITLDELVDAAVDIDGDADSVAKFLYEEKAIDQTTTVNMLVNYSGMSRDDATTQVSKWKFKLDYGYSYSDKRDAYITGSISASQLKTALMDLGDLTAEEADEKIEVYDWLKNHPSKGLDENDVAAYIKPIEDLGSSVEDYGVSPETFVDYRRQASQCKGTDNDGDGKTDSGSKKAQILLVINSLPISYEQKNALYFLNGWAASRLYEAPWR